MTVSLCSQLQVATSSTALAASKEEVKQLELQLKKATSESDTTVSTIKKQHALAVKSLEAKVDGHIIPSSQLLLKAKVIVRRMFRLKLYSWKWKNLKRSMKLR